MYYEFELDFVVDTGALGVSYEGSGVHLNRDVTISLELIDPQGSVAFSDYQMVANPLIAEVSFDILDTGGNVIFPNYKSGTTSRAITITALENEKIFGVYTKDFGVRMTVGNTVNSDKFTSDFFTYANTPIINSFYVIDGTPYQDPGHWECVFVEGATPTGLGTTIPHMSGPPPVGWQSGFGTWSSNSSNGDGPYNGSGLFYGETLGSEPGPFYPPTINDGVVISGYGLWSVSTDSGPINGSGYWEGEISGNILGPGMEVCTFISGETGIDYFTGQVFERIDAFIEFSGDPNYIILDRYEIYYATGGTGDIELPTLETERTTDNPFYLYTHYVQSVEDARYVSIRPIGLQYNTDYYFALVPYSTVGSGQAIYFGPKRFVSEVTGVAPSILTANEIRVENGDERAAISLITGQLQTNSVSGVIDMIVSGDAHLALYDFQLKSFDANLGATGEYAYSHTQLKVVLDQAGTTGAALYDETIYNPYLNFYVETGFLPSGDIGYVVYADNSYSGGLFKALRTTL